MENVKVEIFRNETGEGLAIIASTPNAQKVFIAENEQDARNVKVFIDCVLDYSNELNNLEVVVINYADGDFGVLAKGSDEIFCNPFKVHKHAVEVKNFVEEIIAMATAQDSEGTPADEEDDDTNEEDVFDKAVEIGRVELQISEIEEALREITPAKTAFDLLFDRLNSKYNQLAALKWS